jgi:hypothetical protein
MLANRITKRKQVWVTEQALEPGGIKEKHLVRTETCVR